MRTHVWTRAVIILGKGNWIAIDWGLYTGGVWLLQLPMHLEERPR